MMSFLNSFLMLSFQLYPTLVNFTNFGEHFSEIFWHVQSGSSKFKALGELSLAIRLSIQLVFHGPPPPL